MRRLLLAPLLVLVAGCGGGDDEPSRTVAVQSGAMLDVVADEYSFDPETIVVEGTDSAAGLTLRLRNKGALAHNLRVLDGEEDVGGTPTFQGGDTRESSVDQIPPGQYRLVCTVGNHEDLGMTGTLEVR